jgi:hypothetical protein
MPKRKMEGTTTRRGGGADRVPEAEEGGVGMRSREADDIQTCE